jgi:hypothetical protein
MLSSSSLLFLLLSLLIKNLVTSEEIPIQEGTQSAILNVPKLNHEETHREMRDHLLPKIRRMSQRMQSIILSTTKEFDKMQVCFHRIRLETLSCKRTFLLWKLARDISKSFTDSQLV